MTPNEIRDHALDLFRAHAADKYDRGQAEHGGLITDRELDKEIFHEAIDLVFYSAALSMKKELATGKIAALLHRNKVPKEVVWEACKLVNAL
jgi:hypothetical protein